MVLLQQLRQDIRPLSSYYNPVTYSKGSSLLHGVLSTSTIYCRTSSVKPKSKAEAKAIAKKRHSEAERRRRLRINCQYTTLRAILPNLVKMDKASVLAETIKYVTELQKTVKELEAGSCGRLGCLLPSEEDNLNLNYCDGDKSLVKVMLSCQDRVALISDLTEALRSEKGRVVRAEMVTVSGRTKCVLWIQGFKGKEGISRLRTALKMVVGRPNLLPGNNRKLRLAE